MNLTNTHAVGQSLEVLSPRSPLSTRAREGESSFAALLRDSIASVNDLQQQAGQAVDKLVAGEATDLHSVMIAVEKAKTSFDLLMEVRNKAMDTYRELMRMQV